MMNSIQNQAVASSNNRQDDRKPSVSRVLALELLQKWHLKQSYADELLEDAFDSQSLAGEDRALAQEIFYGVLRHLFYLDFLIDHYARRGRQSLPMVVQDVLRLGLYQMLELSGVPDYAAVDEACRLTRQAGAERFVGVVNGILRQVQRQRDTLPEIPGESDSIEHLSIRYSLPRWIIRRFITAFGKEMIHTIGQWAGARPSLTLRVNPMRTTPEQVLKAFAEAGLTASPHPERATAVQVQSGMISQLPGYAEGWWQVQDATAQSIVSLLDVKDGEWVWDCCAAPGGKASQLRELFQRNGTLWLSDLSPVRLMPLKENWRRLTGETPKVWAGNGLDIPLRPEVQFDKILLDAPCSGLGVLSRRVDLRYRIQEKDIQRLADLQLELLRQTALRLRPGGVIVYSTCTLTDEENQRVVDRFLAQHPQFAREPVTEQGDLLILPQAGFRDGAFAAKLVRQPN